MKIIITENQYKILLESNTESMQNVIDIAFKSLKENVEDGFFEVSYVEDSVYVTEEIKVETTWDSPVSANYEFAGADE